MEELALALPHLDMWALAWGPPDGRLALCLHGFPDSAHGWHRLAPLLAQRGYRVVAPFTRGYAPTAIPADGDYTLGALMFDALAIHRHLGSPLDAVLIGHDWGALTANALAATPDFPFSACVSMSVPPVSAIRNSPSGAWRALRMVPRQLRMSWYMLFFQLPALPEHTLDPVIDRLWRDWSPPGSHDDPDDADVAAALAALPSAAHRRAAVGYYRAMLRNRAPGAEFAALHVYRFAAPQVPLLYLHGSVDGALQVGYTDRMAEVLPVGSRVRIVDDAGHFLQLDSPEAVCAEIVDYLESQDPGAPVYDSP